MGERVYLKKFYQIGIVTVILGIISLSSCSLEDPLSEAFYNNDSVSDAIEEVGENFSEEIGKPYTMTVGDNTISYSFISEEQIPQSEILAAYEEFNKAVIDNEDITNKLQRYLEENYDLNNVFIYYMLFNRDGTLISYGSDKDDFLQYKVASSKEAIDIISKLEDLGADVSIDSVDNAIHINFYGKDYTAVKDYDKELSEQGLETITQLRRKLSKAIKFRGVSYEVNFVTENVTTTEVIEY